jgi:hypothetical protein
MEDIFTSIINSFDSRIELINWAVLNNTLNDATVLKRISIMERRDALLNAGHNNAIAGTSSQSDQQNVLCIPRTSSQSDQLNVLDVSLNDMNGVMMSIVNSFNSATELKCWALENNLLCDEAVQRRIFILQIQNNIGQKVSFHFYIYIYIILLHFNR